MALAFPAGASAASTTSDSAESLSYVVTISMVVPATSSYVFNGPDWTADQDITAINTNNPTGLTLTAKVEAYTGPATVPTTARRTEPQAGTGVTAAPLVNYGSWLNNTTVKTLASSTATVTNGEILIRQRVLASSFTVFGTYSSAIHFTATTN